MRQPPIRRTAPASPQPSDLDPLIRDLVEWVAREPRPYAEVMELWRTSCPRLTVWEDATERGLVVREQAGGEPMVAVTAQGWAFLVAHRKAPSRRTLNSAAT